MQSKRYQSMQIDGHVNRRDFLKISGVLGGGLILGNPSLWAQETKSNPEIVRPKTNIEEALKIPRTPHSLPGPFPGQVVEINDPGAMKNDLPDTAVLQTMFQRGITQLTGQDLTQSFARFFKKDDVVGIKVNPVGPGLISTRVELVEVIIDWLLQNGIPKANIIIWDRFDYMLQDAGFTAARFPGIGLVGLQTMDEAAASGTSQDDSRWLDAHGNHVSVPNFDPDVYYWAEVDAPTDKAYLNQHVFNGKYSYFGKLLSQKLTKLINVPVFKNTGNGISMATKNLGYGAVCNTGRLHRPLFFDVCTEVLAFPVLRDKLVLNITDGLRAQYDGGPDANANFIYLLNTLFFATDPFALDLICHQLLVEKRKSMGVKVNEHPRFTEYLRYAQKLGLGIADPTQIKHTRIS